ncbi:MAG: undecaprenyl diphosphate synthase [uncultured bacterium]|nr:MAG: undecaprenyl diphosphate synthase [uncultured bacterium]
MSTLPRHIAIIMDGNGRWAKKRLLRRVAGHKAGTDAVRRIVEACAEKKIEVLSLFAFSSENWRRPLSEVNYLMELFLVLLKREVKKLHEQNIQVRIIGNRLDFDKKLQKQMADVEVITKDNTGLKLIIAANYGGQWDMTQAMRQIAIAIEAGQLTSQSISAELIQTKLSLADLPPPDLFIRTSGEQRISNFFLWQLAYSELFFTDVLWPDFNTGELDKALAFYAMRERRFGHISEQLEVKEHA